MKEKVNDGSRSNKH